MTPDKKKRFALKIRKFEHRLLDLYKKGKIKGTMHQSIGQESYAVDLIFQLKKKDIVVSNHRCHAHYLALTKDFKGLENELRGNKDGVNAGKCLSQHIHIKDRFYANGIQGGMCPIACGMAWAFKMQNKDNIVLNFIGDGTLGQGIVYESFNIASLWKLPIVFIIENNKFAMSTRKEDGLAGSIAARLSAFGLSLADPLNIRKTSPSFLVIDTYRFCGHSPNDPQTYRSKEEVWKNQDTLSMK